MQRLDRFSHIMDPHQLDPGIERLGRQQDRATQSLMRWSLV